MRLGSAKKNAISGYLNFSVAAAISIITTPLFVAHLGSNTFGTWKALQRLIEVSSALDGKPYQALKSLLASTSANVQPSEKSKIVGSSFAVLIAWLPILSLTLFLAVSTLDSTIQDTDFAGYHNVKVSAILLSVNAVLLAIFNIPGAVLIAMNRGYIVNSSTTFILILVNFGMIIALKNGHDLIAMAIITCAGTLLLGAMNALALRGQAAWWWPRRPSITDALTFGRYGAWINGWAVVATLLFATEPLMLAAFAGSDSVTVYTLSAFSMQFAASITLMTASALAPTISSELAASGSDRAAKLIQMTRELVLTVATTSAGLILIGNKLFVTLWIGAEHYIGDVGNAVIALSFIQIAMIRCEAQILEAGLSIQKAVVFGVCSSIISLITGAMMYLAFNNITSMLIGFIAGRSILSIILPYYTNRINKMNLAFPRRSLIASATCLTTSLAASVYLSNQKSLFLTLVASAIAILMSCLLVPSRETIRTVFGRGNLS